MCSLSSSLVLTHHLGGATLKKVVAVADLEIFAFLACWLAWLLVLRKFLWEVLVVLLLKY